MKRAAPSISPLMREVSAVPTSVAAINRAREYPCGVPSDHEIPRSKSR